jgi:hypothetical protein
MAGRGPGPWPAIAATARTPRYVVTTMLVCGAGTVVTMNLADFARFERYVSPVEL